MESSIEEPEVLEQWSARRVKPITVFYVAVVFAAFMALAYFVFHSMTGVKALALASVGAIIPLLPATLSKVEYRLTDSGLEKRSFDEKKPSLFEEVFRWDQLSHVISTRDGFKYFMTVDGSSSLRRFWKTHISDAYSGEIHVETEGRERVLELLEQRGIATKRPELG